jgi:hypothetical protein
MKFVLILYYCLSTGCFTVIYPELYWSKKDCLVISEDTIKQYRNLEKIDGKVAIGSTCVENDLTWMRFPI